ncbi:DnaJ domain-containing protein [Endozoicomonas sp. SCSIO W0465]|uniref:DnaJ domain-containing protein n=1 Tax=Endozoicomonas sp. SCSIO W0465 TaxID=2918516 RepID=UPI00207570C2|nr:DnaJ domain-containing protein [Endozoicomonas sp. SCSIO W0465]USE35839.1 J domain-containing protein [Endozoicomonas sp. SCSIO W0465]
MNYILLQTGCNLYQSPFQHPCGDFGCFLSFQARPIFAKNTFSDSFQPPFTPKKINERQIQAVDIQLFLLFALQVVDIKLLLLLFALKADHNTSTDGHEFSEKAKSHHSGHQRTSGTHRNEYQETPNVDRPDMAKVNEALDGLGLQGSNLNTITESDVSKAYKKKARIYHPDKATKENVKENEGIFKKIVTYRDRLYEFINFRNNRR